MSIFSASINVLDWYPLNEEEKAILLRSWSVIEPHKQTLGCNVYGMIFDQCPEARKLFPKLKFSCEKKDQVKKSNEFRFQALRFIQVIESAIKSIDRLEDMNPILDNLGRRHGKLELSGKFRSYYWSVFLEATLYQMRLMLESSKKFPSPDVDEAIIVWRYLLRDVMRKIKVGCNADITHRMSQMTFDENTARNLSYNSSFRRNNTEVSLPNEHEHEHRVGNRRSNFRQMGYVRRDGRHMSFQSFCDDPEDDFGSAPIAYSQSADVSNWPSSGCALRSSASSPTRRDCFFMRSRPLHECDDEPPVNPLCPHSTTSGSESAESCE